MVKMLHISGELALFLPVTGPVDDELLAAAEAGARSEGLSEAARRRLLFDAGVLYAEREASGPAQWPIRIGDGWSLEERLEYRAWLRHELLENSEELARLSRERFPESDDLDSEDAKALAKLVAEVDGAGVVGSVLDVRAATVRECARWLDDGGASERSKLAADLLLHFGLES